MRILIPTDFSENAWNAISYALQLFKNEECRFFLLNTYTPAIPSTRFIAPMGNALRIEDSVRLTSKKGLDHTLRRIERSHAQNPHSFEAISSFNLLTEEIKEAVDDHAIDLVIMGTKGASGMEEVFMGSNTVRVIKCLQTCPLLVIPRHYGFIAPSEIAFATDFKRFYAQSELMPLINLAKKFNASIKVLFVRDEPLPLDEIQEFNIGMLGKYLKDVGHDIHMVPELGSVSKTLQVQSQELDIRLLTLFNYRHGYLERMTREPIVKKTAFHTQVPLLVIPELGVEDVSRKPEHLNNMAL